MKNLKEKIKKIDELIEEKYGKKSIPDGIVDVEEYQQAKFKILWILKEPHDKGGQEYWDMRDLLSDAKREEGLNPDMVPTFSSIIYASYGILNDFKLWNEIDDFRNNHKIIDVLKKIAVININKLPAGRSSNDNDLRNAFNKYKAIIDKQIKTYEPDIIIGGNTILNYMKDYFGLENMNLIDKIEFLEYYPTGKRVLIDAWHPANLKKGLTQEIYCDGIIKAAKDWVKNYKK